ncbi:MAG: hypothetical protein RIS25_809 [Actinomycetota bacterium]|jgi:hypothetical protein
MSNTRWAISFVIAGALALSGCASGSEITEVTPSASSTVLPEIPPEFDPEGTAAINKPYFDWVVLKYLQSSPKYNDQSMVAALVDAGFEKKAIEITPSTTGTSQPADSIIVSVKMGDNCLIGQRMRDNSYFSSLEKLLSSGTCLVGETQPIN